MGNRPKEPSAGLFESTIGASRMSKLTWFSDDARKGHLANIRMDNGESCWVIISRSGITVKKSRAGIFGQRLYEESNIYRVAKTAETLSLLYTDNMLPAEMKNPVLKSFTNALLHCRSLTEAVTLLKEVSTHPDGRRGVSFVSSLMGLSDRLRAESKSRPSDDVEEAAATVAAYAVTRSLSGAGQYGMRNPLDLAGAAKAAVLLCFVSSSLVTNLRLEGLELSFTGITGRSGLAMFHFYEDDETARVIAAGISRFEALMSPGEKAQDFRDFADSVNRFVYMFVMSGNEKYLSVLSRLYMCLLDAHAHLIEKIAEHLAADKGKRRFKRFGVENAGVRAKTIFAEVVDILNISMSGACILSKRSLKSGDRYLIKFQREGIQLSLPCVVIWESLCRGLEGSPGGHLDAYRTTIAFKDVTSEKLVRLKD